MGRAEWWSGAAELSWGQAAGRAEGRGSFLRGESGEGEHSAARALVHERALSTCVHTLLTQLVLKGAASGDKMSWQQPVAIKSGV